MHSRIFRSLIEFIIIKYLMLTKQALLYSILKDYLKQVCDKN